MATEKGAIGALSCFRQVPTLVGTEAPTKVGLYATGPYWASFAFSAAISFTGASAVAGRPRGSTAEM